MSFIGQISHFSDLQLLSEKTPLSGPGTLKTRAGRKRRRDNTEPAGDKEMDSLENEYKSKWKRFQLEIGHFR